MSTELYMRVRGRVLGPYDQEKLQALARRGQLSRMHELSEDGVNWVRASDFPDLFVSQDGQPPNAQLPVSAEESRSEQEWFYVKNGAEHGPVDFALLQHMASRGQIGPDNQVWTEGMSQWAPARKVSSLAKSLGADPAAQPGADEEEVAAPGAQKLPQSLCRAAASAQPWAHFVAVTTSIFASLAFAAGILLLIVRPRPNPRETVALGLFLLISAAGAGAGAYLMFSYQSRLRALRYTRTAIVFEKAMDALRALWVYFSICLIVLVVLIVSSIISVLSGAVDLSLG